MGARRGQPIGGSHRTERLVRPAFELRVPPLRVTIRVARGPVGARRSAQRVGAGRPPNGAVSHIVTNKAESTRSRAAAQRCSREVATWPPRTARHSRSGSLPPVGSAVTPQAHADAPAIAFIRPPPGVARLLRRLRRRADRALRYRRGMSAIAQEQAPPCANGTGASFVTRTGAWDPWALTSPGE
jgi:hypothetical protein